MCLATMPYVYMQLCMHLLVVNSDWFQILQSYMLLLKPLLAGVTTGKPTKNYFQNQNTILLNSGITCHPSQEWLE